MAKFNNFRPVQSCQGSAQTGKGLTRCLNGQNISLADVPDTCGVPVMLTGMGMGKPTTGAVLAGTGMGMTSRTCCRPVDIPMHIMLQITALLHNFEEKLFRDIFRRSNSFMKVKCVTFAQSTVGFRGVSASAAMLYFLTALQIAWERCCRL